MRLKKALSWLLSAALAAPWAVAPVVAQAPSETTGTGLQVRTSGVTCLVVGEFPEIGAVILPRDQVSTARVHFRSDLGTDFFYVTMRASAEGFLGILPRPTAEARSVTYFVEGIDAASRSVRSPQVQAVVARTRDECRGRLAAPAALGPGVAAVGPSGVAGIPAGFAGAAAAGASFFTSTTGIILMGAVGAGVATAVIVGTGNPPASGSQ
jgi:hypothetical protein